MTGDFVNFGTFSSFPTTYHVLGTIHSFLFDSGHSLTVWWWVLYIIDCDMNVIVFFAFGKFVSVSFRSWARLSRETPQQRVSVSDCLFVQCAVMR